jgi:lysophospholipase L1-like esterase
MPEVVSVPKPATVPAHRPRNARRLLLTRIILLGFVVSLGLVCLEMMTRIIYDRDGMHFGIEMWKYAKKIKRPSPIPAMGHEHTPNREAFLMGVPVKINSAGLRDREFSLSKPKDTYRILVLGDSITFGWGVEEEKTFAKVLESKLNESPLPGWPQHYEVINTGVGNYNTAQEVAFFKERGRLYEPDMVLIAFFINDAEPTPREERNWLARQSSLYVFMASFWDGILRETGFRPPYSDYYRALYEADKPGWIQCQQAFKDLMATCRQEHIDLKVAIVPELHHLDSSYEFPQVHAAIRGLSQEGAAGVIDLLDGLSGQDPPSLWVSPGDPHPNARAHQIIAGQLYEALASGPRPGGSAAEKAALGHSER